MLVFVDHPTLSELGEPVVRMLLGVAGLSAMLVQSGMQLRDLVHKK